MQSRQHRSSGQRARGAWFRRWPAAVGRATVGDRFDVRRTRAASLRPEPPNRPCGERERRPAALAADRRSTGSALMTIRALATSVAAVFWLAPALAAAQGEPELSAGGLAPPSAIPSETQSGDPSATERELERADREDAGRGLSFLWIDAQTGIGLLGLETFHSGDLVDGELISPTQAGPIFGLGAGARLVFLTLGARFRLGTLEDWQIWALGAEVGLRVPVGRLEPHFALGGGYVSVGSLGGALDPLGGSGDGLKIRGVDLCLSGGLDYFLGESVSVGANLSLDMLVLSRPRVGGLDSSDAAAASALEVYAQDGSGIGGGASLTAVVGLHF